MEFGIPDGGARRDAELNGSPCDVSGMMMSEDQDHLEIGGHQRVDVATSQGQATGESRGHGLTGDTPGRYLDGLVSRQPIQGGHLTKNYVTYQASPADGFQSAGRTTRDRQGASGFSEADLRSTTQYLGMTPPGSSYGRETFPTHANSSAGNDRRSTGIARELLGPEVPPSE